MNRRHVGSVIVTELDGVQSKPIGIVTDRDIIRGEVTLKSDVFSLCAADVMSRDLLIFFESVEMSDAIAALQQRGVRRAPVVDEDGYLRGIVTIDDLLPAVAEQLKGIADLIGGQFKNEG
jgi:CBS domain-containing protein